MAVAKLNTKPVHIKDPSLFRTEAYVNGEWVQAADGAVIDVTNPADGSLLGTIPKLDAAMVRGAIDAAHAAWPAWRATLAKDKARILRRWYELIMENQKDLAVIMTLEQGKSLTESMGEIAYAASFVEWFAEEGKRVYGDTIPQHMHNRRIVVTKEPVGVCAAITPWNFPAAMITRKCAPALAAGCTAIVKPASETPFSALALAVLAGRAGVPKGVFNVVTGKAVVVGAEMTSNPVVRKLSFTGSTEIGSLLMAQCAPTVKKLSMELGGNAPFIVFDDADLDAAVTGAMASKYRNSGQTCVCANRLLVQEGIYDEFVRRLAGAVQSQLRVGNGLEEGVSQGPLINTAAVEKVEQHIRDAVGKGARVVVGGKRHALGGTYFEPTILANVTPAMAVAREETFGPLAPVFRFRTEDEAIHMANDTEFGLAAYFYTRDLGRAWRVGEALEYGMVCVNSGILSTEVAPFGGMKHSGFGREGSKYGIEEYLEIKYWCLGEIDKK
ncbi:MAG: NAD-dependent succinate-semialdehyde dehydrogenase [Gammaproteobacteria bacterium]|nr:NAD-dependent succinate-semialdehyde dehydrogenase [Gammaproteobacteria bacterium]